MKTKVTKLISKAQIKKIHTLLNQHGLLDEKVDLVCSISSGRTQSTKELTNREAGRLIEFLQPQNIDNEKKCYDAFCGIYKLAYEMGILYGNTEEDHLMNKAKLDKFCREHGTVKKNLSEQNLLEMRKTHRQFEAMFKKHKQKQVK